MSIFPLGGVGEIGKNMTALKLQDKILIIDCGLMFPEEEMPGVDIVIPDFTYLVENKDQVLGLVLTHGHEDHIGAIPYFLREVPVPVWGTGLTLGLLSAKLDEHKLSDVTELNSVEPGDTVKVGPFKVEFIRVSHSIPDAVALAIHTSVGTIVYTSDFKFDQTPVDNKIMDISRFARLGDEGVLILLTDSTNVEKPGFTPSERIVGQAFDDIFAQAEGRIIIATFASNIHRMQQVFNTAYKYNRTVAVIGRSMAQNSEIAERLGYLHIPDGTKIKLEDMEWLEPHQTVIITTGSQGEPLSALSRMAMDEHKKVKISAGDTVIISATPIPGNEDLVMRTINRLFRLGADVVYDLIKPVHVSGHGNQEDLKLMINLVKPKYIVPIHGEFRHFAKFIQLAEMMGYERENIIRVDIGDVIVTDGETVKVEGKVEPVGSVMVDGLGVGDVSDIELRDRRHLASDGIIIIVAGIDQTTGEITVGPDVMSRGFVVEEHAEELMEEAKALVVEQISNMDLEEITEWSAVKADVRKAVAKFLYDRTRRRPMVVPIIMEL